MTKIEKMNLQRLYLTANKDTHIITSDNAESDTFITIKKEYYDRMLSQLNLLQDYAWDLEYDLKHNRDEKNEYKRMYFDNYHTFKLSSQVTLEKIKRDVDKIFNDILESRDEVIKDIINNVKKVVKK